MTNQLKQVKEDFGLSPQQIAKLLNLRLSTVYTYITATEDNCKRNTWFNVNKRGNDLRLHLIAVQTAIALRLTLSDVTRGELPTTFMGLVEHIELYFNIDKLPPALKRVVEICGNKL